MDRVLVLKHETAMSPTTHADRKPAQAATWRPGMTFVANPLPHAARASTAKAVAHPITKPARVAPPGVTAPNTST